MQETIWNRYGGYSFVAQTVRDFYDRVLVSKALAPYFDGVKMEGLIEHQIQTVGAVMGGPYDLNVEALRRAHRHLRVQQAHFDELAVGAGATGAAAADARARGELGQARPHLQDSQAREGGRCHF